MVEMKKHKNFLHACYEACRSYGVITKPIFTFDSFTKKGMKFDLWLDEGCFAMGQLISIADKMIELSFTGEEKGQGNSALSPRNKYSRIYSDGQYLRTENFQSMTAARFANINAQQQSDSSDNS